MTNKDYQRVADLAVAALDWEVDFTPKPGLVDAVSVGAHTDMNVETFHRSAANLHSYFTELGIAADHHQPDDALRETIGRLGRQAELTMYEATNGVNTHKGAIWTLGLLVTAYWLQPNGQPNQWLILAGHLARMQDRAVAELATVTYGQQARRQFGIGGAKSEAQQNFPHLEQLLSVPLRTQDDWLRALLLLYATVDDTNVIHRSNLATLRSLQLQSAQLVDSKQPILTNPDFTRLTEFTLMKNISPGGSADLFAATKFLRYLN